MTFITTSTLPQTKQKTQQKIPMLKRRERDAYRGKLRIKQYPKHFMAYSVIPFLVIFCWLPDFIVALKDVSVTIPQAVKRGSNAMLTCNYDMENDTLYSVKWYKGRREFYRYTPKENPAMKVFPSQSGLNVERNLSNQSHVVLLAVPLNISGKFTCEISVEAPSFQTAMVSGEMEVVELPEEQATVTGIQPRYRIGDLVDGNCSIKYSKPAANLTWNINGIVVPPHHIKTYQIEKYDESNLESVMSAVHFMVTTQHFVKGQMRLKCTASIFDIFKEEIESVIEEDRPRIMASGQSYPPDHAYGTQGDSDGYEQNESYLTYFSAPKSSAAPVADFFVDKIVHIFKRKVLKSFQLLASFYESSKRSVLTASLVNYFKSSLAPIHLIKIKTMCTYLLELKLLSLVSTALATLLLVVFFQMGHKKCLTRSPRNKLTQNNQMTFNCITKFSQMGCKKKDTFLPINLWHKEQHRNVKEQQKATENCYQDANSIHCQAKCRLRHQYVHKKHCLVANQNVVNEKIFLNDTNINTINKNSKNKSIATTTVAIDCQQHMPQAIAFATLLTTPYASLHLPTPPLSSSSFCFSLLRSSTSTSTATSSALSSPKSSLSLSSTLGHTKTYAHDSFPLCAVDASKSNNAKYMSKDQTLLMAFDATAAENNFVVVAAFTTPNSLYKTPSAYAPITTVPPPGTVLVLESEPESELLQASVNFTLAALETHSSPLPIFFKNNYIMAFIGEFLLHHC